LADLRPAPSERPLRFAQRDTDPVRLVLGRVAEQLVHLRPEPLLLEAEGAVDVRRATAVPSRGFPADDALVEHEHVDARARQPPPRGEARDAAADDPHCRAARSSIHGLSSRREDLNIPRPGSAMLETAPRSSGDTRPEEP